MSKLTSEIEKRKQRIEEDFLSALSSIESVEELERKIQELETEISELETAIAEPIKDSLFYKIFRRKKYNEQLNSRKEDDALRDSKIKELESLRKKTQETKNKIEALQVKREGDLSRYDNLDQAIVFCVDEDPSLLEDSEFLKSCLDVDISRIRMVTTTDDRVADDVFIYFSQLYKEMFLSVDDMKKMGYRDDAIKIQRGAVDYLISELRDPKAVEEGKYKIPHRYLREAIQTKFGMFYDAQLSGKYCIIGVDFMSHIAGLHVEYDGKVDDDYGMDFERLYDDHSSYLYLHNIGYRGNIQGDKLIDISKKICDEGLTLPSPGDEFGKPGKTTLNTDDDKFMTMLDFMGYWSLDSGVVVLQVPKKIVDGNIGYIGWKTVQEESGPREVLYMLPEYVVGYTDKGKLVPNPIDLEERLDSRKRFSNITSDANRTDIFSYRKI